MSLRFLFSALALSSICLAAEPYAGSDVCAECHKSISETQRTTAIAKTWRAEDRTRATPSFTEGPLHYAAKDGNFSVEVQGKPKLTVPVQATIGGERHGISFLLALNQLGGIPLARPALLEARYALSHTGPLVLSPGFNKAQPADREDELGRTLSLF